MYYYYYRLHPALGKAIMAVYAAKKLPRIRCDVAKAELKLSIWSRLPR
jgi:hypothetical protein